MYIRDYFKPHQASVRELLLKHGAAELITSTPSGLRATMADAVRAAAPGLDR